MAKKITAVRNVESNAPAAKSNAVPATPRRNAILMASRADADRIDAIAEKTGLLVQTVIHRVLELGLADAEWIINDSPDKLRGAALAPLAALTGEGETIRMGAGVTEKIRQIAEIGATSLETALERLVMLGRGQALQEAILRKPEPAPAA